MKGIVNIRAFQRGRLLWELERENLIVTAALALVAKLAGGTTATNFITVIGFGSGTGITPTVNDTDLSATPAYYKATAGVTFSGAQAQFSWSLVGATDTGAVGMTIGELGFFANTGTVAMPVARAFGGGAPSLTMWAHLAWPTFTVAGGGTYTGTWTLIA